MQLAPALEIVRWFNTDGPLDLAAMRGSVVAIHAFQMLCPGCVHHGIPQIKRIHEQLSDSGVKVIGLHSVFEHHAVMTPEALAVFIHENRLTFPIGVDMPGNGTPIPRTMEKYGLSGTPSLILIDRKGRQRFHRFGAVDDLIAGAAIGQLLAEADEAR